MSKRGEKKDIIQNFEKNKNKYKDDGKPNFNKIPKEDARKAAEEYWEWCESLTDFLEACIKNDIITTASCAGHPERWRDSNVDFDISNDRTKRLIEFIVENKLADFIYVRKIRINQEEKCILTVDVNMEKRDLLYKSCTKEIERIVKEKGIDIEKSESLTRKIMTVAEQYKLKGRVGCSIKYNIQNDTLNAPEFEVKFQLINLGLEDYFL